MPPSFRIFENTIIREATGLLIMWARIEYRPDSLHLPLSGELYVRFGEQVLPLLGNHENERAIARLSYYAINQLKGILAARSLKDDRIIELEPTFEDLTALLEIDPRLVDSNTWVDVDSELDTTRKSIFIGCGQQSEDEKTLGLKIKELIDRADGFSGCYAQDQQSLTGLTSNIFDAIHDARGFIAVMHRRDKLSNTEHRASLWIEQELAIASFIRQTLKRPIHIKAYVQEGVRLEGIRSLMQLNPRRFNTEQEVLDDLESTLLPWLKSTTSRPH